LRYGTFERKKISFLTTWIFIFLMPWFVLHGKGTSSSGYTQKKILVNCDGSIGIGFYSTQSGSTSGGLNGNLDILLFNTFGLNYGLSSGYLALSKSVTNGVESKSYAVPANMMIAKLFSKPSWNAVPYFHLSPGMYVIVNDRLGNQNFKMAAGGSVGTGLLIFILKPGFYIDMALRAHYLVSEKVHYPVLSSNLGLSFVY